MTPDTRIYDAVLVHGYRFPYRGPGSDLGNRNRAQAAAIASLHRQGRVSQIVVAGGHWFGRKAPPFAEIFSEELANRGVTGVIPVGKGRTTTSELDIFLSKAAENEWRTVGSLATRDHNERVQMLRERRSVGIAPLVAEEVLEEAVAVDILPLEARREAEKLLVYFSDPANTAGFQEKEQVLRRVTRFRFDGALAVVGGLPGVRQIQNQVDG